MSSYDVTVIGGGAIGFGTVLGLQRRNPYLKIALIEKDDVVSNHQTGNNSGVIHSGIYYKPGSLKADFCVEGRQSIADFCVENGLKYDRCGKIIVAYDEEELPRLNNLYEPVSLKSINAEPVQLLLNLASSYVEPNTPFNNESFEVSVPSVCDVLTLLQFFVFGAASATSKL